MIRNILTSTVVIFRKDRPVLSIQFSSKCSNTGRVETFYYISDRLQATGNKLVKNIGDKYQFGIINFEVYLNVESIWKQKGFYLHQHYAKY